MILKATRVNVLLFLIIAGAGMAQAQVQKGDNLISFSSSLSTQSASPSSINATVLLSYERYFTDKLSVGVGPFLTMITSRGGLTGIYGGNVFANYGFLAGSKFYPYVGGLFTLSQSISTQDTKYETTASGSVVESGNSTVAFYGVGAKVGTKYFITERINLDLNINYSTNISSKVNGGKVDIGSGGIIQLFAGVGIIFGKPGQ